MHTHEVINQLEKVLSALKDCETGQRGYLITGDANYLQPYTKCHAEINGLINNLQTLTIDNAEQQQRIQTLRDLTTAKLNELHRTIELRRDLGFEAARQVVVTDLGKKTMDSIRSVIASMKSTEEQLLESRMQRLDKADARGVWVSSIIVGLGCVFLIGTLVLISYLISVREKERKEMERRVSEFYSMVSHELRTPLTSITGSLSLMQGGRAGELPPRAVHLVQIAYSESERLIRLVNDILDIKKIEAGKLELKLQELQPSEIVQNVLAGVESIANQASVKLSTQINVSKKFACDQDRVKQVLTNLLYNAIKFSPPGAEVIVRVDSAPTAYRFSVIDKGPGIPKDQMHKLFGLFQQLDLSDTRQQGGTGLGLAISKAIVEEHHGKIGVDSIVGQGSTFWFELPINTHSIMPAQLIESLKPGAAKYTALVVDDDEKLCDLLSMMLEEQSFKVVKAGSVREADVYLVENENPDVIILDIGLPDGNGLALMDKLRHNGKTESIPVVILSGHEPVQDTYGDPLLIDWIKKPFDERKLLAALRVAVKKRASGLGRVLVVEDDLPTRELIKQDIESLGVECIEAGDGVTAIQMVRTQNPDLIVLDLALPDLDGFEIVQILRRENFETIPLLVYTARDLTNSDKQRLTLGLTAHLIKTRTSEKELLNTLKELLNGLVKEAPMIETPKSG